MVEKITISPSEVRGYGDIVSPKTTEDFTNYMSGLTETEGLYTLTYDETGTYLNLSASPTTIQYGGSTVFTAVLTQAGEPVEGETVSFYEGETLLGTDTTDSNGEATLTKSDFSIGVHSVKAVYDEVESSSVSVTVNKVAVTVSLSADQSSITYGSNVALSGVLSLGSGVTLTIYDGSTSLGTVTTTTDGAFSKTVTTPTVGSHTFRVEYAGDSTHDSATASTSVTVNKIASTITFSTSSSQITVGDSVTLSGVLSAGSGASVKIYNGSTLLDTVTSGSGGAFSKTVSGLSVGSYTFKAVFDGDATHGSVTSSNVSVTVVDTPTPVPDSIDLTGTKSILSYVDSESCVLTATVLDENDDPVEGATVELYKDNVLWDTLTTGSAGTVSKTYNSAGIGDVGFTAECGSLVTEIFVVQDCSYYNTAEVTRSSTNGSTIYDNSLSQALPSKCEISLDVWSNNTSSGEHRFFIMPKTQYSSGTTQPQYAFYFDLLRNNQLGFGKRENNSSQGVDIDVQTGVTLQTYHTIKYVKDGTSISAYIDGSLKGTFTLSWIGNYSDYTVSMMRWSASGTSKIKNVKFKPL